MKKIFLLLFILLNSGVASQIDMLQEACQSEKAAACYELGLLYEKGIGLEQNSTKAKAYYQYACESDVDEACKHLTDIKK